MCAPARARERDRARVYVYAFKQIALVCVHIRACVLVRLCVAECAHPQPRSLLAADALVCRADALIMPAV